MRGVVLPGNSTVDVRSFDDPKPGHGQVVLRMRASGICGSDIRAIYREHLGTGAEAYRNVIAGHEPAGEVVEVGRGVGFLKPGDRVLVYHIGGCGHCNDCRKGYMISCTSVDERAAYGWQRHGGHADFILADAAHCIRLPEPLSYVDGAMIACGGGTGYEALTRVGVSGQDDVLVTGLGPVGLGVALMAKAMGAARVVGVDGSQPRRDLGTRLGLIDESYPADADTMTRLRDTTAGLGFSVTVECSGSTAARRTALEATRSWGRCALVGAGGTLDTEFDKTILFKQLTIFGSWVTSLSRMDDLVHRMVSWNKRFDVLATDIFRLDEAAQAYSAADAGRHGKVCIVAH